MNFNWFKKNPSQDIDVKVKNTVLYLTVNHLGWRARLVHSGSSRPPENYQGDASMLEEMGPERLEKVLRMAIRALPSSALNEDDEVVVELDSADAVWADSRLPVLSGGNITAQALARIGVQLLNCNEVSYGACEILGVDKSRCYAFIDSQTLGLYLSAMDRLFFHLSAVQPVVARVIARASHNKQDTYAGLLIGADQSQLVIVNSQLGALLVRSIPIGVLPLVNAVASRSGISRNEAIKGLSERDYISPMHAHADEEEGDGPIEQTLRPILSRMMSEIELTLDYFEEQQACGRPQRLEVLGEHYRLNGLDEWLSKGVSGSRSLDVINVNQQDWFEDFIDTGAQLNLLTGLENSGIRVGKLRYSYVKQRLVKKTAKTKGKKTTRRSRSRKSRADEGWLGKMLRSETSQPVENGASEEDRQYLMLVFVLFGAILFFSWDSYEALNKKHRNEAIAYIGVLNINQDLQRKVRGLRESLGLQKAPVIQGVDKVLWTEKFLALANAMNEHLWLTDVYLREEERSIDKISVLTKKLVIQGAALPSTLGHIAEIADYIERLEADENRFMSDFREVSFDGSMLDEAEQEQVVRFTLAAPYDANKRLKNKEGEEKTNKSSSLGKTLNAVENRNRLIEKARKGDL